MTSHMKTGEPRPRPAYGAVVPGDALTELDDDSLEIVGGIVRTERDTVVVAIERRANWQYPAVIIQTVRRHAPEEDVVWMKASRCDVRSYELRALADLLQDAADRLEHGDQ